MKKKLLALAMVAAMAVSLMACGGGSSSGSDAAAGSSSDAAAPAAASEGDIRLVNGKIEVDQALKNAAAAYKEKTGVTVAIESMGGGVNIQDTLKGYYQADNMPDIFVCGSDADFGNWTGLLADLSDQPWAADTDAGYADADGPQSSAGAARRRICIGPPAHTALQTTSMQVLQEMTPRTAICSLTAERSMRPVSSTMQR